MKSWMLLILFCAVTVVLSTTTVAETVGNNTETTSTTSIAGGDEITTQPPTVTQAATTSTRVTTTTEKPIDYQQTTSAAATTQPPTTTQVTPELTTTDAPKTYQETTTSPKTTTTTTTTPTKAKTTTTTQESNTFAHASSSQGSTDTTQSPTTQEATTSISQATTSTHQQLSTAAQARTTNTQTPQSTQASTSQNLPTTLETVTSQDPEISTQPPTTKAPTTTKNTQAGTSQSETTKTTTPTSTQESTTSRASKITTSTQESTTSRASKITTSTQESTTSRATKITTSATTTIQTQPTTKTKATTSPQSTARSPTTKATTYGKPETTHEQHERATKPSLSTTTKTPTVSFKTTKASETEPTHSTPVSTQRIYLSNHNRDYHEQTKELRMVGRLHDTLLKDYKSSIRPVMNPKDPVIVTIDMGLSQLFDLDERNQIFIVIVWLRLSWNDALLRWNETEYDGLDQIEVKSSTIWRPDLTLVNSASSDDEAAFDVTQDTMVRIKSDGSVFWNFPAKVQSNCPVDITYFPFDQQVCHVEFGSWVYDGTGIDVEVLTEKGDMQAFSVNVEWDIPVFKGKKKVTTYSGRDFPTLIWSFTLQRRSLYFMFNLVLPVILITAIGMLTFCLPPDAGEKISLCVTMVISMALILLLIAESLPPTSLTIPLIGIFFAVITIMLGVSTLMTVMVLQLHHNMGTGRPVPRWMRVVILRVLARILCFHMTCKDEEKARRKKQENTVLFNKAIERQTTLEMSTIHVHTNNNGHTENGHAKNNNGLLEKTNGQTRKPGLFPTKNSVKDSEEKRRVHQFDNPVLHQMLDRLNDVYDLMDRQDKERQEQDGMDSDWRQVAMVIDRLFFVLAWGITILASLIILLDRPAFSEQ